MTYKITIPYTLPGLNEYTAANRSHRQSGAGMKREVEINLAVIFRLALRGKVIKPPVIMRYLWVERDFRRDGDNVAFAKKFIQDALVSAKILQDDSRKFIRSFSDDFAVDRENPRVEVEIEEVSG